LPLHQRVICSTISFRRLRLEAALRQISDLGFSGIDLGALPGVCDHVPFELTADAVVEVASTLRGSGLAVRSINADVGDLNRPLDAEGRTARDEHLEQLLDLAVQVGAPAIVLPCGSQGHAPLRDLAADIQLVADELRHAARIAAPRGVEIWVESQHSGRLCFDLDRAGQLIDALRGSGVRSVLDFSHVIASGDDLLTWIDRHSREVAHVHIRDARRGDIHLSPGNGDVDFAAAIAALSAAGYGGDFSLELETADVADAERPAAAARAGRLVSSLL
jgi:sugar phosphate isomerase/epimerase